MQISEKLMMPLPVGHVGDVNKSERSIYADKAVKANQHKILVFGHSLDGSVALELRKHYPGLQPITYGPPVLAVKRVMPKSYDSHIGKYSKQKCGDPVSVFDRSAHST